MSFYLEQGVAGGSPIQYWEDVSQPVSPTFSFGVDQSSVVRSIQTPWSTWPQFMRRVIGYSAGVRYVSSGGSIAGSWIQRQEPWAFTPLTRSTDGRRYLWATNLDGVGVGVPGGVSASVSQVDDFGVAKYERARMKISFNTLSYDIYTDDEMRNAPGGSYAAGSAGQIIDESSLLRYVTPVFRPQGETITLQGQLFRKAGLTSGGTFTDGTTEARIIPEGLAKVLVSTNLMLTWHAIPMEAVPSRLFDRYRATNSYPAATNYAIDSCLGCVNKNPIPLTAGGFDKSTLLLTACEMRPFVNVLGQRNVDITYMLKHFNPTRELDKSTGSSAATPAIIGHNHVLHRELKAGADSDRYNGWYEALADPVRAKMVRPNCTNFVLMADNKSVYDWRDFEWLFRPAY